MSGRLIYLMGPSGSGKDSLLNAARERYPELLAILLQVDEAALRQRLQARGRESAEQIEARLARSRELQRPSATVAGDRDEGESQYLLNNSGPLDQTVTQLLQLLSDARACV